MITENNRTGNSETASVAVKASAKDSKINLKKIGLGLGVLAVIAISMAFPFGLGLLAIVWAIAMAGAVIGTGIICFKIAKELIGGTASFNYSPNMAYLTGKKGGKEKGQEKTDKAQMENDKEQ